MQVTPKEFMEFQSYFGASMCECISIEVPHHITTKKLRKSVDISLKWLDQCIALRDQSYPVGSRMGGVNLSQNCNLLGVIQGGGDLAARKRSAMETAKRNVAGNIDLSNCLARRFCAGRFWIRRGPCFEKITN